MSSVIFVVCLLAKLFYWDLQIKLRVLFSYRWGQRYVDRKIHHMAASLFAIAHVYLGLRIKVDRHSVGPLPSHFAVVVNHQSVVDIVAVKLAFPDHPIRFVAKKELGRWFPGVSPVLRVQRHALIDRKGNRDQTMRTLDILARRTRLGICPVIFAEGTRSRTGEVLPFQAGAVRRVLAAAPIPIVAVAIDGGYRFSRLFDLSATAKNAVFRVRIVGVFPVDGDKSSVTNAVHASEDAVRAQIDEWHRG